MTLKEKIFFHFLKNIRMAWYQFRYRVHPWKNVAGVRFPVSLNLNYSVLRFIDNGTYEGNEIGIISQTLEKNDRVLELGSGMGFISTYCAKQIGSDSIFTFEANEQMEETIKKMYQANNVAPRIRFNLLGDGNKQIKFFRNKKSFLASSTKTPEQGEEVIIDQIDLNQVINEINPTYLVMDIEGAEYDVFRIIDFQSINKVQFELHPRLLTTDKIQFIFDKLRENGFIKNKDMNYPDNFFFSRSN